MQSNTRVYERHICFEQAFLCSTIRLGTSAILYNMMQTESRAIESSVMRTRSAEGLTFKEKVKPQYNYDRDILAGAK